MSRTLVVGDVHGCAEELAALHAQARPDRVLLLGDLFRKGPDPAGVWDLIAAWQASAVLGNHDAHILRAWRAGQPIPIPEAAARWLDARPLFVEGEGWLAVHAGLHPALAAAGCRGATARI